MISPWSMFYLICVCIVVPLVMSLPGLVIVLFCHHGLTEQKVESEKSTCDGVLEKLAVKDAVSVSRLQEETERLRVHAARAMQVELPSLMADSFDHDVCSSLLRPENAVDEEDLKCPI